MDQKQILITRESVVSTKICMLLTSIQLILLAYFYSKNDLFDQRYLFILLSCITLIFIVINIIKNKKTCFLKIEDDYVKISRKREKLEDISIKTNEIAYLETKFNRIIIHDTHSNIHSVNLDHIKSEKKRWEIKEILRQLSHYQQQEKAS
ncbi:hypothetical protein Pedsa_1503 [Pseudopedobacter saltans DSM 12145]|uniref:DUF304 domain-containing protein n=1 Tax=Pseudopedobacter saltans (strain ATCC 51119 / DSM 12145 / JCM 21818 / CCUG 39354 / LMG 10337 / NBRC 100064 / NCIMB 13643) TaxID=762903 RepID=F0S5B9_PSESL|nr:hypothetical protein [Pseudopedobacter saltans]ADY52064.1 hypothetical protein Pedsa_1503 [Pseudopedobacter saltans DSM 12145]